VEGAHGADEHREGERLTLSDAAAAWSGATYERIAEALAPIHRRIVEMLEPQPGERFLDLACGTGGVALVAARTGADVTGLDISADQLVKAQAAAEEAGVSITFDEGDAQALPYADSSFDAVASVFGMIFAPDHGRAGAELTRVCRPGAQVAITAWPNDAWAQLGARLRPNYEGVDAQPSAEAEYVRRLLPQFDLRFERGESTIAAHSPEELWDLLASSVPPLKAWLDTLDDPARESARAQYMQLFDGGRLIREYVLILGTRHEP
jgi:SAM-dependent methyltransferase